MSSVSKKRCKSQAGLDDSFRDEKRMKIDPENVKKEILEHHSARKKKKHSHRHRADETPDVKESISWNVKTQPVTTDNDIKDRSELSTKVKHQRQKKSELAEQSSKHKESEPDAINSINQKKKKKKRRQHVDNDCNMESKIIPTEELIGTADEKKSEILPVDIQQQQEQIPDLQRKKKKKKKQRQECATDDDCVMESKVDAEYELVDLVDNDEITGTQPADAVADEGTSEVSKKKKKKHHRNDADSCEERPRFVPVLKSLEKPLTVHNEVPVFSQQQADLSQSSALCDKIAKRIQPVHLHLTTQDLRFKPGAGFSESQPDASKDGLWWEDIAMDSNLEMWLVRAPVDFQASMLDGTRGALYGSVLIPEPNRPGKGFQVSIQNVQRSKLVVLVPSKQDKRLHVASDVNGYVSIVHEETLKIEPTTNEDQNGIEMQKRKKKKRKSEKIDNDEISYSQ